MDRTPAARTRGRPIADNSERRRRGIVERRTGEDKGRFTVYVDTDTAIKLRRYCFDRGLNISDECARAIEQHVRKLTV